MTEGDKFAPRRVVIDKFREDADGVTYSPAKFRILGNALRRRRVRSGNSGKCCAAHLFSFLHRKGAHAARRNPFLLLQSVQPLPPLLLRRRPSVRPSVVCLTCRILVPVKSVFLLVKASPRSNSEAVGRSVGRRFGNGNRKLRFRAKKWARRGHACSRTGTGTDWEGALLEA